METQLDDVRGIIPGKDTWKIKVRVLRLWKVPNFLNPNQANSIEMVLIDEKGGKIQATVRKQLLYMFEDKFVEGNCYKISYFAVGPMSGAYRATVHPYKIMIQMRTKVESVDGSSIKSSGLTLLKCGDILKYTKDFVYLVDSPVAVAGCFLTHLLHLVASPPSSPSPGLLLHSPPSIKVEKAENYMTMEASIEKLIIKDLSYGH